MVEILGKHQQMFSWDITFICESQGPNKIFHVLMNDDTLLLSLINVYVESCVEK